MTKIIEKETLIGKRVAKLDAPDKATGRTRYINDMVLPRMLHAKILRSTRVHAKIIKIDVERRAPCPASMPSSRPPTRRRSISA